MNISNPTNACLRGLVCLVTLGVAAAAQTSTQNPGSLLLYPDVETEAGRETLITLTNTSTTGLPISTQWTYIDRNCLESNRTIFIDPADTLTVLVSLHIPFSSGFLYVSAGPSSNPVVLNHLVGEQRVIDAFAMTEYSTSAFSFQGIGNGAFTDVDGDGNRDLDGIEYSMAPDRITIPRFFGQGSIQSDLVLVGLTGKQFDTTAAFTVRHNEAGVFSAQYTFGCWERTSLSAISGLIFDDAFLASAAGVAIPQVGWFQIDGVFAASSQTTIIDPALLAVLIEGSPAPSNSGLPFASGYQANGALLSNSNLGDP